MSNRDKRQRAAGSSAPACSAFDEDGERMPTEHEAIAVASALIEHYEPTPGLAGSDFDKGMQALQRLMGRRPNAPRDLRGDSRVTVHADVGRGDA